MPEFFQQAFAGPAVPPLVVLARLLAALVLGGAVAWIHRRARGADSGGSFAGTLVLLTILIALVTQVIGDSVARAFSLVGALSIVRFRTVVRDTQDTAYVIFAVVLGMAVGAENFWAGAIGLGVVGLAVWLLRLVRAERAPAAVAAGPAHLLHVRVAVGHDLGRLLGPALDTHLRARELLSVETARQGVSLDAAFEVWLRSDASAEALVKALNLLDGVESVSLRRRDFEAA
jgi:hypothetical protein